jgi:hypothetical protein
MSDFQSPTGITWNGHVGSVQYGGDKNLVVMFYTKPMHHPGKSTDQGRPVYEDTIFVRIHPPGERLNIVDRPARKDDQTRYALQWAQFSQNKQQAPDGTPIDLLYPDHPAIGATLRANGVYTVEQCADLSGPAIDSIGMGAQRYCNDAKKYIQASEKGVKASQLRHELDERDGQIRTLTGMVESLKAEVERLRELNLGGTNIAQLQALISGQQLRPQYPAGAPKQLAQPFDAQTAQINATHATSDVARAATKRKRARIEG